MAAKPQSKKLKTDVDYVSTNSTANRGHDSSPDVESFSSTGNGSDTSGDFVFVNLSEDGQIDTHEVSVDRCPVSTRVQSGACSKPPVIDLTGDDSLDGFYAQPSTSGGMVSFAGLTDEDNPAQLLVDVEWVTSQLKKGAPHLEIDPNLIFIMLESCGNESNRRELVLSDLTKDIPGVKNGVPVASNNASAAIAAAAAADDDDDDELADSQPDLFDDVSTVMKAFPQADANIVYGLLESQTNQKKRVKCVMHILKAKFGKKASTPRNPEPEHTITSPTEDDPFCDDVQSLALIFPSKEEKLLYARLRVHQNKPDRVQVVSRELMSGNFEEGEPDAESPMDTSEGPNEPQPSTSGSSKGCLSQLQHDLELLCGFYPDCDPNFIFSRLEAHQEKENRVEVVSNELETSKNYPKRKDAEAKEKRQKHLKKWMDFESNLPQLLATFDDIKEQFYNFKTKMSESYKKHVQALVEFDFPWLKSEFLTSVCEIYEHHLLPSHKYLQGLRKSDVTKKHRKRVPRDRASSPAYPGELDEYFFKELMFVLNEDELEKKVHESKKMRQHRFEEAKSLGLLQECSCCYDDEVLLEDMLGCPEGHMFCRSCIRRSTEVVVGEARAKFPCLTGNCETVFTLQVIQKAVSPKTYSLVLRRMQEEELREAGIENLVTCPFCSFATIMENPDDKVFKCLNPECMKESCRLCQEENHVPLRCDEVEKKMEVDMRTYIERKMTEAMLRTCHNCKKQFYKIEGCNKMTCVCGASMCYVCRQPIKDYSHFNNGRCNDENAIVLHKREVEDAFKKAQEEYFKEHPEAKDVVLKYDPREHLEGMDQPGPQRGGPPIPLPFIAPAPLAFQFDRRDFHVPFFGRIPAFRRMFWVDENEESSEESNDETDEDSDET